MPNHTRLVVRACRWTILSAVALAGLGAFASRAEAQSHCKVSGPTLVACLVPKHELPSGDPGVQLMPGLDCYWPSGSVGGKKRTIELRQRADNSRKKYTIEVENRCKAATAHQFLEIDVVVSVEQGTIAFEELCSGGAKPVELGLGAIRQGKTRSIDCRTRKYKKNGTDDLQAKFVVEATKIWIFDDATGDMVDSTPLTNKVFDPEIILEKAGRIGSARHAFLGLF